MTGSRGPGTLEEGQSASPPVRQSEEVERPNWANQTIWTGDNLPIMRGMNSASIDLIYLDPPFNSKHNYAAPIGSKAAGAAFKDTWGLDDVNLAWHGEIKHEYPGLYALLVATRQIHGDSMMSYLIYMAIRLMEMKRLLKPTGSIYLHCDPTASHYLKLLMDSLFGKDNFQNEVIWQRDATIRGAKKRSKKYPNVFDCLLYYVNGGQWTFRLPYRELTPEQIARYRHTESNGRRYRTSDLGDYSQDSIKRLADAGLIHTSRTGVRSKKYYLDEAKGTPYGSVWTDIVGFGPRSNAAEYQDYPTQKPLALLRRIIKASSDERSMILDPFCGCATACIAAQDLQRQWVGIDISEKAADLVQSRMRDELGLFFDGAHRNDIPTRTDIGKIIRYNDERNKRYLYGEQGGYCNGCETHFAPRNLTVDHIIPRAKGGTDHVSNLQLLCGACNSMKGTQSHEHLLVLLTNKGWIKNRMAA